METVIGMVGLVSFFKQSIRIYRKGRKERKEENLKPNFFALFAPFALKQHFGAKLSVF
jgi:hypothetical protein